MGEEGDGAPIEVLNSKAVSIINRVKDKLTGDALFFYFSALIVCSGKDFGDVEGSIGGQLGIDQQVSRLIEQATSEENLCQCYIGWCPFW